MRARGYYNWPVQFPRSLVAGNAERGELHVVERGGAIVATLALQWSDKLFWGDAGTDDGAGYVHRLAVRRRHSNGGLGYRLLDWAAERVRARERGALRLDVVRSNRRLRDYYEAAGFRHFRDVTGEHTHRDGTRRKWETSLYERACPPAEC